MATRNLKVGYVVYPSAKLYGFETIKKEEKFVVLKQLIFGDHVRPVIENNKYVTIKEKEKEFIKVRVRGAWGYMQLEDIQSERPLEVNFVDVGQGDGCHLVMPDDTHYIVDAGPGDNMYRFLKWRFNIDKAENPPPPFNVIISHSDADHYNGFEALFSNHPLAKHQFTINKIYHNGIIEESGADANSLGTIIEDVDHNEYITDLCDTDGQYKKRVRTATNKGSYIGVLEKSKAPKIGVHYGSPAIYDNGKVKMDVLGPVTQMIGRKAALPIFDSNKGKTKNGHSIILKLTMGKMRILLGGDLNTHAENYLLSHFSGKDIELIKKKLKSTDISANERSQLHSEINDIIVNAREWFESDIAKSCHHGSADFTSEFLQAINPLATIISSGDDEPHCHPRPDTLGTIGKHSRGERSLIFCTELARSGKEFLDITKLDLSEGKKKERLVVVYGMINVRTDGQKAIIAQKLEKHANGRDWDIHCLEYNDRTDEFEYVSKHS